MRSDSAAVNAVRTINEQHPNSDPFLPMALRTLASFQVFIVFSDSIQNLLVSMETKDSKNIEIFLSEKSYF